MSSKSNKKRKSLFLIAVLVLLTLIILIFGNIVYKIVQEKYLLMNYPIKYEELVEKYASENEVDKFLIYAIIKTESDFKPDAESNLGARGLMQIMEPTFEWIKYRYGDSDNLTYDLMYDPDQNIRYGTYLITYLIDYFGSVELAVCAYHAGIGNVDSWLQNPEYSSDGANLDAIPIPDTEYYLEKVTNALNIYHNLYMEEN
ncbi:MAG: lytic transglycosylase domain-containing protein [Oscillospiraceae bacterium]|nr:lytic transglycosylase domain-containing protein [Oscillospiraceae bacterium]